MKRYKFILFLLFPVLLSAQAQPKTKWSSQSGLVKFCLGNRPQVPQKYCWENQEARMIYNPVNGSFSISVVNAVFALDTAVYDSLPVAATVALRQRPEFLFSGELLPRNPIDFNRYGQYPVQLNGTVNHADTSFEAALNATVYVNAQGTRLRAEAHFTTRDYQLAFFEQFGLPEDQLWLVLDFQLNSD